MGVVRDKERLAATGRELPNRTISVAHGLALGSCWGTASHGELADDQCQSGAIPAAKTNSFILQDSHHIRAIATPDIQWAWKRVIFKLRDSIHTSTGGHSQKHTRAFTRAGDNHHESKHERAKERAQERGTTSTREARYMTV